ncbi:MAG: protein kinase [Planctomycetes bacterium]|nr:protein kinase [Planctomycetota bacterium]
MLSLEQLHLGLLAVRMNLLLEEDLVRILGKIDREKPNIDRILVEEGFLSDETLAEVQRIQRWNINKAEGDLEQSIDALNPSDVLCNSICTLGEEDEPDDKSVSLFRELVDRKKKFEDRRDELIGVREGESGPAGPSKPERIPSALRDDFGEPIPDSSEIPADENAHPLPKGDNTMAMDMDKVIDEGGAPALVRGIGGRPRGAIDPIDSPSVLLYLKEQMGIRGDVSLDQTGSEDDEPGHVQKAGNDSGVLAKTFSSQKYTGGDRIGVGGMGEVRRVFDRDLRRAVALKKLLHDNRKAVERFIEEAQVTGQLEHPNIVPVHELGVTSDHELFFTMKLVRGRSLKEILIDLRKGKDKAKKKYTLSKLIDIFQKVCEGIAFAHSRGVIHRDVKPANIMVGEFGEVQVMDWGLAKVVGREDTSGEDIVRTLRSTDDSQRSLDGSVIGTPSYMPPEQAKGAIAEVDERSDIYSLGALLYELITLSPPFAGKNAMAIIERVVKGGVQSPEKVAPKDRIVPRDLAAIAMKALSYKKADRYRRVGDLMKDLEAYRGGFSVSAISDNAAVKALKWLRRNPILAGGMAAAVVLLFFGIFITSAYFEGREQEKIEDYFRIARSDLDQANFQDAMYGFVKVLGLDEDNKEALAGVEETALQLAKQKEEAAAALAKEKELARIGEILREARASKDQFLASGDTISQAGQSLADLESSIDPWEKLEKKMPLWDANRTLVSRQTERIIKFTNAVSLYSSILAIDPSSREARSSLAALYYERLREAEEARDNKDVIYYKKMMETYDDGVNAAKLQRGGACEITTNPRGAEVFLLRYEEGRDRRLIPVPYDPRRGPKPDFNISQYAGTSISLMLESYATVMMSSYNSLGRSPVQSFSLPEGSYLLYISMDGYREVRRPFIVERDRRETIEVDLYESSLIPESFVYIPGGRYRIGGDVGAAASVRESEVVIENFAIQAVEETTNNWNYFINLPEYRDKVLVAGRYSLIPRQAIASDPVWQINPTTGVITPEPGREGDHPINFVTYFDAKTYLEWFTGYWKDQGFDVTMRLPTDNEWEVAARGADQRIYPWGNYFDWSFCFGRLSFQIDPRMGFLAYPRAVGGAWVIDESPFGVRDMAGSHREWVDSFFDESDQFIRSIRGGSKFDQNEFAFRCASRTADLPLNPSAQCGFRVAFTLPDK